MNKIKTAALAAATIIACSAASAQDLRTGYFNDEYLYRYRMNPAIENERGFVGVLPIANLNIGVRGNLHLTDVLYNINGQTTTFLNPNVAAADAMKKFSNKNRFDTDVNLPIFAVGFKKYGGYNTVALNIRESESMIIPKALFSLLKEGISNKTYEFKDLSASAQAYAEIAFSHSRKINSEWRAGAAVKLLIGAGRADALVRKTQLDLGVYDWIITTNGELTSNVKGLTWTTDDEGLFNGAKFDKFSLNGFGLAFDLGTVYTPTFLPDWKFSFAVVDLGFIAWHSNELATTNGDKTFNTDKYTFNVDKDAPNSFSNEWDRMKEDLEELYQFDVIGNTGRKTRGIGATMNVGIEYTLPMYNQVSFGLLNTSRLQGRYSWTDFRLSANYTPSKIFSATASVAAGTYGTSFGWLLNFHTKGFALFLGMDHTAFKFAKQGVPLSSNASLSVGLDFPL